MYIYYTLIYILITHHINMSSTDANTKEQLVKFVKGWIQMDNEMKEFQKEIKEKTLELDKKETFAKDFDKQKRIALKQNPASTKLLMDP